MIKSMTGFGLAAFEDQNYSIQIEIKALNSKFLDLSFRSPKQFSDKENEVKTLVSAALERGKVNISIEFVSKLDDELPIVIQEDLFQRYFQKYAEMAASVETNTPELFKLALQSPHVILSNSDKSDSAEAWEKVKEVLIQALEECDISRIREGAVLMEKFSESLDLIQRGLDSIKELAPIRKERLKNKIKNNFSDWVKEQDFDANRFEQELIYYFEKLDISEEIVRLEAHLKLFSQVLNSNRSEGKKMGFVSQELGREINTIGSKANDATIQHQVINMKDELEKIKEQALNIL
ncbi:YicC/YloC family endoribonuclease [Cyclobacterium jeungdonense]|uniref:YicC/YloC family endoribonuclease n=1 Tax=Cyclobacterium jeungdonense TaxID=708087 RepID=A0ABT8C9J5_9BACT|nr:YicC/YloC family endoribonuclease [Cyclobacterium jeungdonense]MDN3688303.1 YicC/YloC family endoribonuclease [Cyclobacterium jeungdonense]